MINFLNNYLFSFYLFSVHRGKTGLAALATQQFMHTLGLCMVSVMITVLIIRCQTSVRNTSPKISASMNAHLILDLGFRE